MNTYAIIPLSEMRFEQCNCSKCEDINVDIIKTIEKINEIHKYLSLCRSTCLITIINGNMLFVDGVCNIAGYRVAFLRFKNIYNIYYKNFNYIIMSAV